MRPIDVSITTVGPLGATLIGTFATGASGRSCAGGAVDCWHRTESGASASDIAAKAGTKSDALNFMSILRVNHAAGAMPAAFTGMYRSAKRTYTMQLMSKWSVVLLSGAFILSIP